MYRTLHAKIKDYTMFQTHETDLRKHYQASNNKMSLK